MKRKEILERLKELREEIDTLEKGLKERGHDGPFKVGDVFVDRYNRKAQIVQFNGNSITFLDPTRMCLWNSGKIYLIQDIKNISWPELSQGLSPDWEFDDEMD